MSKKLTNEEYITNAKKIHNNFYTYEKTNYIGAKHHIIVTCPTHGDFPVNPNNHTSLANKNGCPECKKERYRLKDYIERCKKVHNNFYTYEKTEYVNIRTDIIVTCPIHDDFVINANNHLNLKQGCAECNKFNNEIFIRDAEEVHGKLYDYSLIDYKNTKTKVNIICNIHGIFPQSYESHVKNGCHCPDCKITSKGEILISKILTENNIQYITQKKFDDCKNKRCLPFDFYLPEHNICIEYDGIQHFESIKGLGGEKKFEQTQINDKIKTTFCLNNNIILIRIKYNEKIENKINFLIL